VPVLWITGPAGAGKSTVSWQLFTELAGSGTPTGFAEGGSWPQPGDPLRGQPPGFLSQVASFRRR
jgi:hypothetical protein